MRRLEQVTAPVVAAGLAIVSYWLFFSWAGGGDTNRPGSNSRSEAAAGLEQPLLAGRILERGDVLLHLIAVDGEAEIAAESHDPIQGP